MFSPDATYEHCSAYEIVFTLQEADNSLLASREACQAFATLSTLASREINDERYADFITAGAVEAIVDCLDHYGSDEVVALHSCVALYGLTRHSSALLTSFVVECGGIESILQCIPFHIGDTLVCFHATNALLGCLIHWAHVLRMWMCPQIGSILDQLCYAGLNVRQKTSAAIAINFSLLLVRMLETAFCENDTINGCEENDDNVIASEMDSLSFHQHLSDSSNVHSTTKQTITNESISYLLSDTNFPSLMSEFVRIHYQDTPVVSSALKVLVTFGKLSDYYDCDDGCDAGADNDNHNHNNKVNNGSNNVVSIGARASCNERGQAESSHLALGVMQLRQTFEAAAEPILKGESYLDIV